jgi:uncharacterized protein YkwD
MGLNGRASRGAWVALLSLAACGGAHVTPDLGEQAWGVVEAPAPSADAYRTERTSGAVLGEGDHAAIEAAIARAGTERNITLQGDGRLALLAAWISEHVGAGGALPPAELTRFFAHHLGLVEPTPHLLMLGQSAQGALADDLGASVGRYLDRQRYDGYGVALFRREGLTLAIVALSVRRLSLEPVPRSVPAATPLGVTGALGEGLARPSFVVTDPRGEALTIGAGGGPSFHVELPIAEPGEYHVELSARSGAEQVTVAAFPIYAGAAPPESIDLAHPAPPPPAAASPDAVARDLLALANEARLEHGLSPLEADDALAAVGRAHSADMAEHGFLAHQSPTTGSPVDRAEAAGIRSGLLLENVGQGPSASAIHRGFMASPGHRENLLNPDVTHLGVGVVETTDGGRPAYVVTEMFIRVAAEIDPAQAAATLLSRVNEARRARGATPLEVARGLEDAAERAARRYFDEPSRTQQELVDAASAEVRGDYRRVGGLMALTTRLDEATSLEPLLDPSLRYVGVGVAQGDRPGRPPKSLAIVFLMAWPR